MEQNLPVSHCVGSSLNERWHEGSSLQHAEPCSWIWVLWSAGEEHRGAGRGMGCPCHALTSIIGSGGDEAGWLQILTLMKVRISVGTVPSVAMTQDGFWVYGLKLQVGRRGTKGGQGGLFVHIPLGAVISTVTFKHIRKDKSSPGCVAVLGLAWPMKSDQGQSITLSHNSFFSGGCSIPGYSSWENECTEGIIIVVRHHLFSLF